MKKTLTLITILLKFSFLICQNQQIVFSIYNGATNKPIDSVEIRIDYQSSVEFTGKDGKAIFNNIPVGEFIQYQIISKCCHVLPGSIKVSEKGNKENQIILYLIPKPTDAFIVNIDLAYSNGLPIKKSLIQIQIGNIVKKEYTDELGSLMVKFYNSEFEIIENSGTVKVKIDNSIYKQGFTVPRLGGKVDIIISVPSKNNNQELIQVCSPQTITIHPPRSDEYQNLFNAKRIQNCPISTIYLEIKEESVKNKSDSVLYSKSIEYENFPIKITVPCDFTYKIKLNFEECETFQTVFNFSDYVEISAETVGRISLLNNNLKYDFEIEITGLEKVPDEDNEYFARFKLK